MFKHKMATFFLDFEAFQVEPISYILKELCILDLDNPLRPLYLLFNAPYDIGILNETQQRTVRYCETHLHRIAWKQKGNTQSTASDLLELMMQHFGKLKLNINSTIYIVGGIQKTNYIKSLLPTFRIITYKCRVRDLPTVPSHIRCMSAVVSHSKVHCACLKCYGLYLHYIDSTI